MPSDIDQVIQVINYLRQHPTTNQLQRRFKISYFDACRLQAAANDLLADMVKHEHMVAGPEP